MYENLDKLRAEVKRIKKKIEDDKGRLRLAEEKLARAEHSQIIADVKAVNFTPEQLAEFLKLVTSGTNPVTGSKRNEDPDEPYTDDENDTEDTENEED